MSPRTAIALILAASVLAFAGQAVAGTAYGNHQGITKIRKGVFDLGFDSVLILRNTTTPLKVNGEEAGSSTQTGFTYAGGPSFRYFLKDNLAVGADLQFFTFRNSTSIDPDMGEAVETSTADTGGLGFATGHYFIRLGSGLFFKPGVGVGGFVGNRSIPDGMDDTKTINSSLSGLAAKADLGFAFYAGQHFNLRAGLNFTYYLGNVTPEAVEGEEDPASDSFSTLEAGFSVGVGYSF